MATLAMQKNEPTERSQCLTVLRESINIFHNVIPLFSAFRRDKCWLEGIHGSRLSKLGLRHGRAYDTKQHNLAFLVL